MSIKVYLAAALSRAPYAEAVAAELREHFEVISGWHARTQGVRVDPRDDEERTRLCALNLAELVTADVLVALVADGQPRATYGEIGYALALCKPVVFVHAGQVGRCILDAHSFVVKLDLHTQAIADLPLAIETAAGLVGVSIHDRDTMPDLVAPEGRMVGAERGLEDG